MLTTELRKNIDEKWEDCWPLSTLRPIGILDLISYLFFLKKIDDNQLVREKTAKSSKDDFFHLNQRNELRWRKFKDLEAQRMHDLFTMENGVLDLMQNYDSRYVYHAFVKGNLLLVPTPKLLANSVDIIKIIEAEDGDTKSAISEYLLHKAEVTGQNGQVYLPAHIVKLIVSIAQPGPTDIIFDPSAGNGSLLVNCAMFISNKNPAYSKNFKNDFSASLITGLEADATNLRIGAMNMMLHGIDNPQLKALDVFPPADVVITERPTLITGNLVFIVTEDKMTVEGDDLKAEATRKEIFYLDLILKNLHTGTRVAIIIPENILYNSAVEVKVIRQQIIDDCKLEAVISLADTTGSHFPGASILVFNKHESTTTDKVWFYKTKLGKENERKNAKTENVVQNDEPGVPEQFDIVDILDLWKRRAQLPQEDRTGSNFFVTSNEIKANNYNLAFNEYRMFLKEQEIPSEGPGATLYKGIKSDTSRIQSAFPEAERRLAPKKNPLKKAGLIIFISIAVIGVVFLAYYYLIRKGDPVDQKKHPVISVTGNDSTKTPASNSKPAKLKDTVNFRGNKYTVISRAYFYRSPEENTRKNIYLNNWINTTLIPTDEKNGFVYVVYTNKKGETTSGWLNKKDLAPAP